LELPGNWRVARNFVVCSRAKKWEWLDVRDKRQANRVSVGELQGRKSLGKLEIRWKDYIKVDHKIGSVT
jgi:hypothetical protein